MTNPTNDPEQRLADDFRHVVESAYQDMAGVAAGRKEYHLRHDELTSHLVKAAKAYAREREVAAKKKQAKKDYKFITEIIDLLDNIGTMAHDTARDEYVLKMLNDWKDELAELQAQQQPADNNETKNSDEN